MKPKWDFDRLLWDWILPGGFIVLFILFITGVIKL